MKKTIWTGICALALVATGCDSNNDPDGNGVKPPVITGETLFVVNAGGYGYSNASLTSWNSNGGASNEVFYKATGFNLGDQAQSATVQGDILWIAVSNSNVVFAFDTKNMKEVGRVDKKITSPRYIHFVNESTAYITQMYSNKIAVIDPRLYSVKKYIDIPVDPAMAEKGAMGSTEEMVQIGDYVYVNLWSYGKSIVKIDTKTDKVVGEVEVGVQPYSIVKDSNGDLWTICNGGGWEGNPIGYEAPTLVCVDAKEMTVKKTFAMQKGDNITKLAIDAGGKTLYWAINKYDESWNSVGEIYSMNIAANALPAKPFVGANGNRSYYSLTVSPMDGRVFAADPVDYTQPGTVYIFNKAGEQVGSFEAGVCPTSYAWMLELSK